MRTIGPSSSERKLAIKSWSWTRDHHDPELELLRYLSFFLLSTEDFHIRES
jgi:hypothetical protein